jgi:hypothetical protein
VVDEGEVEDEFAEVGVGRARGARRHGRFRVAIG